MTRHLPAALLLLIGGAAAAEPPALRIPVDCRLGEDCFVQNYVDVDPGPAARDFTCGPLTYDGHKGTDFRLLDRAAMRRGVAVLAAADGTVAGRRDGEPDDGAGFGGASEGRECGNGVRLEHGGGWATLYCHLRRGSVTVRSGEAVRAGQKLGEIGLSGASEFPHLHLTVLHRGQAVDPYTGAAVGTSAASACGSQAGAALWAADQTAALAYRASGLLGAGFADRAPDKAALAEGQHQDTALPARAGTLVWWVRIFGLRAGDRETLRLLAPDGEVLAETATTAPKDLAVSFKYVGRRLRGPAWPPGRYRGEYRLLRAGEDRPALTAERTLAVE